MNDSIGGAILIDIAIIFIGIIIMLFTVSFAYNKAYRAKNIIIQEIERSGYSDIESQSISNSYIINRLSNLGYNQSNITCANRKNIANDDILNNGRNGYCVYRIVEEENGNTSYYYEVETRMTINIPLLNISFPVYGQTIAYRIFSDDITTEGSE